MTEFASPRRKGARSCAKAAAVGGTQLEDCRRACRPAQLHCTRTWAALRCNKDALRPGQAQRAQPSATPARLAGGALKRGLAGELLPIEAVTPTTLLHGAAAQRAMAECRKLFTRVACGCPLKQINNPASKKRLGQSHSSLSCAPRAARHRFAQRAGCGCVQPLAPPLPHRRLTAAAGRPATPPPPLPHRRRPSSAQQAAHGAAFLQGGGKAGGAGGRKAQRPPAARHPGTACDSRGSRRQT